MHYALVIMLVLKHIQNCPCFGYLVNLFGWRLSYVSLFSSNTYCISVLVSLTLTHRGFVFKCVQLIIFYCVIVLKLKTNIVLVFTAFLCVSVLFFSSFFSELMCIS